MNIHLDAPIKCFEQSIQNNDAIAWISTINKGKCFRIHKRQGKITTPSLKCIHLYIHLNEKLYGSSMYVFIKFTWRPSLRVNLGAYNDYKNTVQQTKWLQKPWNTLCWKLLRKLNNVIKQFQKQIFFKKKNHRFCQSWTINAN